MKDEVIPVLPKLMTQGGAITATGGGLWTWLGNNYQQVGTIGVLIGIGVGLAGLLMTHKSNRRREENQIRYHNQMLALHKKGIVGPKFNSQSGKAQVWLMSSLLLAASTVVTLEGYRTTGYYDPVGIPTTCFGHTETAEVGKTSTSEQCQNLLLADLQKFQSCVIDNVTHPLRNNELAAFTSFAYNVGCGAFKSSTLLKRANRADLVGACNELPRWVYATRAGQKIKLNGLVNRREAEKQLCLDQ